jgi:hypothetical protein
MNIDRIKEIQKETSYPESVSVQQALLKVWNECEQEQWQDRHEKLMKVIELIDNPSENTISEEEWLKNGKLLESAKYRFKPNK